MQELENEFALLDDWEERYHYVIDLGKALPAMAENQKNQQNKIQGCVSQVWLQYQIDDNENIHFQADSDAHIVRGLIALLLQLVEGKTAIEILKMDFIAFFTRIGLADNLSAQRANGLRAMIDRIREIAKNSPSLQTMP